MKAEEIKKQAIKVLSDYAKGMYDANKHMIELCEDSMLNLSKDNAEPNSPRQITNGGKKFVYNRIKEKLKYKNKNILKGDG